MVNDPVIPCRQNLAYLVIPLKANEINGVDTTSFLKNFVVLMYLFKFDFLELYWLKRGNQLLLKN